MAASAKAKIVNAIHTQKDSEFGSKLRDFFTMLAVCHTCMVDKDKENPELLKY